MTIELIIALSASLLLGAGKAGLKGLGMIVVPMLALVYGAKASTGIMMPLLITGDILAVIYYKRHVKWKYLKKFLPSMVVGVLIAVWFGKDLPEAAFKNCMAFVILISVIIMIWRDRQKDVAFPKNWGFAGSLGVLAGFTTMIGNLAGSFANIFFLATRLPKNEIIGTSAWLFFIINLFKVPFHYFVWGTINLTSLKINLTLIPAIVIGFYIGLRIVSFFNEQAFRYFLLIVTGLGAILIFIK